MSTIYKKPNYRTKIERILKNYIILRQSLEVAKSYRISPPYYIEQVAGGGTPFFPSNSNEKLATNIVKKEKELERIGKAMRTLNINERSLIEDRYLNVNQPSDQMVYEQLNISRRSYYYMKSRAMRKIATALGFAL